MAEGVFTCNDQLWDYVEIQGDQQPATATSHSCLQMLATVLNGI